MHRLLTIALLALPALARGQSGLFPTAPSAPWTCDATRRGDGYSNSTDGKAYYCDGSAWIDLGGAGSITPGVTGIAGCTNQFVIADGSSLINCATAFVADGSGAGNGVFTVRKTMSGASATSNFLSFVGTFPSTLTALTSGAILDFTGAGSSSQQIRGLVVNLNAGFTGGVGAYSLMGFNTTAGTRLLSASPLSGAGQSGVYGSAIATTTGTMMGVIGIGGGGDLSIGTYGAVGTAKDSATSIGAAGVVANTGATPIRIGGHFGFTMTNTFVESALHVDNGAVAAPIVVARDNGAALPITGATATWQIADGAWPQVGNGVLTNATMTAETQARGSGGLIHSYTWTNAQVAALAGTAGDITVATLPAKTQVRNAYVVITGQAAGPTTVTVSCGDAIGGTPFINYTVALDAKVAASTVYGDAVAERGTSLDVEFYYLPSYTATTLVTCHFISTGANLSTVTGSTGRVIIETALLP